MKRMRSGRKNCGRIRYRRSRYGRSWHDRIRYGKRGLRLGIWFFCVGLGSVGMTGMVAGIGTGIGNRTGSGWDMPWVVYGAETDRMVPNAAVPNVEIPNVDDWVDIDRFLQTEGASEVSFSELVKHLMNGEGKAAGRMILDGLRQSLFQEISHGGRMAGQLLALGLIGAVFANFSDVFSGSQISETGFFMTYLLAFTVLAASFFDSIAIAAAVLERQVSFMKVLLPSYFLAVAWAGGVASSAAWYELVLFLIAAIQWLYLRVLLPFVRVYLLLVLAGHMAKEEMLSKMTELLKTAIQWGSRSLMGLVLGFQLIQGMVLPYADAVKATGVQKLLQVIPGIGQGAGAVTKLILGSGVLIKNTMGAAAVVILVLLSLVPVIKLLVLLVLYRTVAAVLEPVADKRLVGCISGVADGQKLLLTLVVSALLLFAITLALICAGTNVSYLACVCR